MVEYTFPEIKQSGGTYAFSYSELKEDYWKFRQMNDAEFIDNVLDILHFACFVCFFKEVGNSALSDIGIVHELIHLANPKTKNGVKLPELRQLFNKVCELA